MGLEKSSDSMRELSRAGPLLMRTDMRSAEAASSSSEQARARIMLESGGITFVLSKHSIASIGGDRKLTFRVLR